MARQRMRPASGMWSRRKARSEREEAGEAEDGRPGAGAGAVELEAVPVGGGGQQVADGAVGADEAEYGAG